MNAKIIAGIVAVIIGGGFIVYLGVGGPGGAAPVVPPGNSGNAYRGASANTAQNAMSPEDTYLAYKKDLFVKTTTAEDIGALAKKYLPGSVAQGWDAAGGPATVFSSPIAVCAWLNAEKAISPDAATVKVDSQNALNPQSVKLAVSAAGGYKGTADMVLEQDGWKVEQELWPNWTPAFTPCAK